jgi:hypothetical protein
LPYIWWWWSPPLRRWRWAAGFSRLRRWRQFCLNPINGISRMFSWNSLAELVKTVLKSSLIGGIAVWVIWHNTDALFALMMEPLDQGIRHVGSLVMSTFMMVAGSTQLLVAIDVPLQMWEHGRKLKMTKESCARNTRKPKARRKSRAAFASCSAGGAQADDGGTQGRRDRHQPDPLCRGLTLPG